MDRAKQGTIGCSDEQLNVLIGQKGNESTKPRRPPVSIRAGGGILVGHGITHKHPVLVKLEVYLHRNGIACVVVHLTTSIHPIVALGRSHIPIKRRIKRSRRRIDGSDSKLHLYGGS